MSLENGKSAGNGKLSLRVDVFKWIHIALVLSVGYMGLEIRNLKSEMRLEVREYFDAKFPSGDATPALRELSAKVDGVIESQSNLAIKVQNLDTSIRLILRED